MISNRKVNILIIGGGAAGVRAAIEAKKTCSSNKVALVTEGLLGKSGVTANACSDRMTFHATLPYTLPTGKDNWKYHAQDIYKIGGFVSDKELADILAKNSGEAITYLESLGVPWVKKDGKINQFLTDGSKYPRGCYTGPDTAQQILIALIRELKRLNIEVIENYTAVKLLTSFKKERVIGCLGFKQGKKEESPLVFFANTIVLATGGAGDIYEKSLFPSGMTGDGYSIAYNCGAEIVNIEFIQIGLSSVKTGLACSGSLMRAIPRIVNEKDEEFISNSFNLIFKKGSSWPLCSEDDSSKIDIAIYREIQKGSKVYLDYSRDPRGFDFNNLNSGLKEQYFTESCRNIGIDTPLNRLREINLESIIWLKENGINLEEGDKIEIFPFIQHFQGGVKINNEGGTTVKELFACGEVAGGQHGANRPGGNALLDTQVFGKIAGKSASIEAKKNRGLKVDEEKILERIQNEIDEISINKQGAQASDVKRQVQDILFECANVIRTEDGLSKGLEGINIVKEKGVRLDNNGIIYYFKTLGALVVAEMLIRAARLRSESRGPHVTFINGRLALRDELKWRKYIVIRKINNEMKITVRKPG